MGRMPFCLKWLTFGFIFFVNTSDALASGIQILPTRIVLGNKARSAELTLVNRSQTLSKFRIYLKNMRTDDDGTFEQANEPEAGEKFADTLIRFSPRAVDIQPGSTQTVRLVVRKPKGLAHGEYRTHMVFRSTQSEAPSVLEEKTEVVSVSLVPILEISIPVIVRHGNLNAEVELSNPRIQGNQFSVDIARQGTRSLYGDLHVFSFDKRNKQTQIGFVKGIAVYVPNGLRHMSFDLDPEWGVGVKDASYVVQFKEDPTYGGDQEASLRF